MKTYRYLVLLLLAISCLLSACSDQALNDAVEQPQNTATDIRDDNTDQPPACLLYTSSANAHFSLLWPILIP